MSPDWHHFHDNPITSPCPHAVVCTAPTSHLIASSPRAEPPSHAHTPHLRTKRPSARERTGQALVTPSLHRRNPLNHPRPTTSHRPHDRRTRVVTFLLAQRDRSTASLRIRQDRELVTRIRRLVFSSMASRCHRLVGRTPCRHPSGQRTERVHRCALQPMHSPARMGPATDPRPPLRVQALRAPRTHEDHRKRDHTSGRIGRHRSAHPSPARPDPVRRTWRDRDRRRRSTLPFRPARSTTETTLDKRRKQLTRASNGHKLA